MDCDCKVVWERYSERALCTVIAHEVRCGSSAAKHQSTARRGTYRVRTLSRICALQTFLQGM